MDKFTCSSCGAMVSLDDRFRPGCGESPVSVAEQPWSESPLRRLDALLSRSSQPRMMLASAVAGAEVAGNSRPAALPAGPTASAVPAIPAEPADGTEPAGQIGRARWYRRHWYRRPRVMIPLVVLLVAGVAAGTVAYSIHSTFSTLNKVSTPPALVSGAVLGGDDSVVIDTGPAQSAVAAASGKTPTATSTNTPESTATTESSATATEAPQPTEEPATEAPESSAANEESSDSGFLPPPPASTTVPTEEATEEATEEIAAADIGDQPTNTSEPDPTATEEPTAVPTDEPASEPTDEPTVTPTGQPTELPTAEPTDVPTEVPTEEPAATETVPTPEPEPDVTLSEIERIKNGSFEEGTASWYLERGAESVETDAVSGTRAMILPGATKAWADQSIFFLPATTYHLSVWGKTTAKGDPAEIGVTFTNADGVRLKDAEPAPLAFTSANYTQQTLSFTVPDGVATVKVYAYNGNVDGDFSIDDVSVRSEVPVSNLEPAEAAADDDAINILVMGVDARPGEPIDIGVRPDSLMVVRLNPETGSCRTLAIPRDTRTELPGYGQSKINHALAVGGIPYQQQVVENLLNLKIDHYLLIDFAGFEDLVDAVGGIRVTVEQPFVIDQETWFAAGEQTMDGKHALQYARYRGGPDGDFGRIARQQQVLRALLRKGASLNVVGSLNELLPAVASNLRTDMDATEMARLGLDYRGTCTDESVEMLRLEGYDAWFDDPLLQMQLIYVVVDEAEIRSKVAVLKET